MGSKASSFVFGMVVPDVAAFFLLLFRSFTGKTVPKSRFLTISKALPPL